MSLRTRVIRLAYANPDLRGRLLPLLVEGGNRQAMTVKTADKIYITQVAFGLWVRGDAHARKAVEDHLEGHIESVVARLHGANQPRRPEPVMPTKGRGKKPVPATPAPEPTPHEVVPITVERVWEEAKKTLAEADLLRNLDVGGFHQWFDDHLSEAMASLGGITLGIATSHPEIKGNTLVWQGKWYGAEQDEDTEVAADTEEDHIARVIPRLQGNCGHVPARIEYLRNIGWQGNEAGHYSVYPMTATFQVDPMKFLETVFTKAALPGVVAAMAAKAISGLE